MASQYFQAVFFIYGLSFFSMGLAVAMASRRSSALDLAPSLKYLAAFGLLHSLVELEDMFLVDAGSPAATTYLGLRVARLLLLAISAICLIQFGVKLLVSTLKRHHWLRYVPVTLFSLWLLSFVLPHLYTGDVQAQATSGLCLQCHQGGASSFSVVSGEEWINSADVWARYLLYLPGSLLAALALFKLRPGFRAMGLPRLSRDSAWAGAAFAFNAVVAGLVVPPASYFPASVVNYASFFSLVGLPPQLLRAVVGAVIAYFIVSILDVFEIEHQRRLERSNQERFEAQHRAMEAQRHAHEQLEEWNRALEEKVQERTQEVERRNREVAILEERDRIAREMHDSLGQVLGYISLKIMALERLCTTSNVELVEEELREMELAVEEATLGVRESILSLRTGISPEVGLVPALSRYLVKFGELTGLKTELLAPDGAGVSLPSAAEIQLLRVIQEALTNVRKHAKASIAKVSFRQEDSTLTIMVEDNGLGFDPDRVVARGRGFGLETMRERAEAIGASLPVSSVPGHGTRVTVRVPNTPILEVRGIT